jgi:branched-subunit amino acid transport protein
MTAEMMAVGVIVGMGIVTYVTRAAGVWAMGFLPLTPRVEAFLRHLASSVVVALLVGAAMRGDGAGNAGLAATLVAMVLSRSAFFAILAGVGVAAGLRLALGL